MRNEKGYITVFLSLLMVVLLALFSAAIQIARQKRREVEAVTAAKKAGSHIKGYYNSYLFEEYHILLFDKNLFGGTDAGLEAELENNLRSNLSEGSRVNSVTVTDCTYLMENELEEFKNQLLEQSVYLAGESGIEKIISEANGKDEPVGEDVFRRMENEMQGQTEDMSSDELPSMISGDTEVSEHGAEQAAGQPEDQAAEQSVGLGTKEQSKKTKDPRKAVQKITAKGVARLLLPEEVSFSEETLSGDKLPSEQRFGYGAFDNDTADQKFRSYDRMKKDVTHEKGWGRSLSENAAALMYIGKLFNSALEKQKQNTVLNLEIEYLIAGKMSDDANFNAVVNRLILLRMGPNFAYLLTDIPKMETVAAIAASLTAAFPPSEPVVKYLLAGCWAYVESVADVYMLLRNKKVPLMKNRETWQTDFDSLAHLDSLQDTNNRGLDYKAYLMILVAAGGEKTYYRMLDLMQENANHNQSELMPKFYFENAVTGFSMQTEVDCGGSPYFCNTETKY